MTAPPMTPAAQTMTPTDEEMVAWCEKASLAAALTAAQWGKHPDGYQWSWDAAMLRAIAERLRKGRHG